MLKLNVIYLKKFHFKVFFLKVHFIGGLKQRRYSLLFKNKKSKFIYMVLIKKLQSLMSMINLL